MNRGSTLYQKIYDQLTEDIALGVYAQGKRLPTEEEVAKQYFVSRISSKKALTKLAENGLIVRIPGRGSFVKKDCQIPLVRRNSTEAAPVIALLMGGYGSSFGLDIVNGAVEKAEELGMHLILKNTGNDQKAECKILNSLMVAGVAGIIVQPAHGELYNEELLNAVYSKFPIVMIDRSMAGIDVPFVGIDNVKLGRLAVSKLIAAGHRNIALLALEDDQSSSLKERMQGYLEAFVDSHLAVRKDLWLTRISDSAKLKGLCGGDPATHEAYVDVISAFYRRHPDITAVFGTEYSASKAAWDAARRVGRRVPEDLSIVSFDFDSSYLGLHQLTHVKQPQKLIGSCAVEVISGILTGKAPGKRRIMLDGEWVEGNSMTIIGSRPKQKDTAF